MMLNIIDSLHSIKIVGDICTKVYRKERYKQVGYGFNFEEVGLIKNISVTLSQNDKLRQRKSLEFEKIIHHGAYMLVHGSINF